MKALSTSTPLKNVADDTKANSQAVKYKWMCSVVIQIQRDSISLIAKG